MRWLLITTILGMVIGSEDELGSFSLSSEEWDTNGSDQFKSEESTKLDTDKSPEFDSTETDNMLMGAKARFEETFANMEAELGMTDELLDEFKDSGDDGKIEKREAPFMNQTITSSNSEATSFWDQLKQAASETKAALSNTLTTVTDWVKNTTAQASQKAKDLAAKAWNSTKNGLGKLKNISKIEWTKAMNMTSVIWNATKNGAGKLKNKTIESWIKAQNWTQTEMEAFRNATKLEMAKLKNASKRGWEKAKNWTGQAWNLTKEDFNKLKNTTKSQFAKFKEATLEKMAKVNNWTKAEVDQLRNYTRDQFLRMVNATVNGTAGVTFNMTFNGFSKIKNATLDKLGRVNNWTQAEIDELRNYTKNEIIKLKNLTKKGWSEARNWAASVFGSDLNSGNKTRKGSKKTKNSTGHEMGDPVIQSDSLDQWDEKVKEKYAEFENKAADIIDDAKTGVQDMKDQLSKIFQKPTQEEFKNQLADTIAKAEEQISAMINENGASVKRSVPDMDQIVQNAQTQLNAALYQANNSIFGPVAQVNPNGADVLQNGIDSIPPELLGNMYEAAKTLVSQMITYTQQNLGPNGDYGNMTQEEFQQLLLATQQSFNQVTSILAKSQSINQNKVQHDVPTATEIPNQLSDTSMENVTVNLGDAFQQVQKALKNITDPAELQAAIDRATAAIQAQMALLASTTGAPTTTTTIIGSPTMGPPTSGGSASPVSGSVSPVSGSALPVTGSAPPVSASGPPVSISATTLTAGQSTNGQTTTTLVPPTNMQTNGSPQSQTGPQTTTTVMPLSSMSSMGSMPTTTTLIMPTVMVTTISTMPPATGSGATTTTLGVSVSGSALTTTTTIGNTDQAGSATTPGPAGASASSLPPASTPPTTTIVTTPDRTQAPVDLLPVPDFPPTGCTIANVDPHSKVSSVAYQEVGISNDCQAKCTTETMFQCKAYTWAGPGTYCILHGTLDKGMVSIQNGSPYNITDLQCQQGETTDSALKLCVFAERGIEISMNLNMPSYRKHKAQSIQFCQQMCSLDTLDRCTSFAYDPRISFFDGYNCVTFHRSLSLTQLPRGTFSLYENPCLLYSS